MVSKLWSTQGCVYRFLLQRRWLHNEESGSNLSCTWHDYLPSSSSLPNIIKLSQTVWRLWPAQDLCFRGDNYIMKTVRVVSYTWHAYWFSSSFLPKNIKICSKGIKVMECTRTCLWTDECILLCLLTYKVQLCVENKTYKGTLYVIFDT